MSDETVIAITPHDSVVLAVVQDARLDEEKTEMLQAEVKAAAEQQRERPLILDLAKVEFFPSLSLGALVRMHSELKSHGQRFLLCGLQEPVRSALAVTRLDKLFEIYRDVDDALAHVQQ